MYVEMNARVDKGQVLCIVEAMKLMNEIEADVAGTVIGVLAEDGAPVEYGQPLFKIAPA
jgi:biotin carboxyl carrier protein